MRKHLRKPAGKIKLRISSWQFIISRSIEIPFSLAKTTRFSHNHCTDRKSVSRSANIYIYTTPSLTFHHSIYINKWCTIRAPLSDEATDSIIHREYVYLGFQSNFFRPGSAFGVCTWVLTGAEKSRVTAPLHPPRYDRNRKRRDDERNVERHGGPRRGTGRGRVASRMSERRLNQTRLKAGQQSASRASSRQATSSHPARPRQPDRPGYTKAFQRTGQKLFVRISRKWSRYTQAWFYALDLGYFRQNPIR